MNSFKAIYRAIVGESKRQIEVLESGGRIYQETRRWDDNKDASFAMRVKENAQDYRYFPEPDLLPVHIDKDYIRAVESEMPETAEKKRNRFTKEWGLSPYDADVLTSEKEVCLLFEETALLCSNPKEAANIVTGEIMRLAKETETAVGNSRITGESLAAVIGFIQKGVINRNVGKMVIEEVYINGVHPEAYIEEHGLAMVDDMALIEETVRGILQENTKSVADYRAGKEKAFGYLVGASMKALNGKANPQAVHTALKKMLKDGAEA